MAPRTVGVEEELLLVDPANPSGEPELGRAAGSTPPYARVAAVRATSLDKDLFQHQLETRTEPTADLASLREQLVAARDTGGRAGPRPGLAAVAVATVPLATTCDSRPTTATRTWSCATPRSRVTPAPAACTSTWRSRANEEGVAVIDRIGPWLPALRAVSANSPYADGRDTGYASWRSQLWSHWPSAGPTEAFWSLAAYRQLCRELMEFGAARDPGMLYFDARLSARQPTVEVRIFDVCTDPADAVLLAALVRGLVEHTARCWRSGDAPARLAHREPARGPLACLAARVADTLVHPVLRRLAPAARCCRRSWATSGRSSRRRRRRSGRRGHGAST
ncbi:carboxylate-amine ligase [Nocardioides ungokensis]|uniref:carboxylate-amine ligase n=1 Tax=Nocardioides ungokensis TaxID=1643322 RepID=UPI0015DDF457|nr:YbdK family carboxylate-amine ligase [Nocardioides ungokensis]